MYRTEMDYYSVLNVPRSATKEEIALAYRKLAIRLCPHRDPKHEREFVPLADETALTHMATISTNRQWDYINMAYDVLGNELYRHIYDRYGEAGLFEGILLPNGYFPPYMYHGDNMKVYHDVFGSYSPYANLMDAVTNPPGLFSTKQHGIGVRTKDPAVEKLIGLDLEEVRFGCVKLMHVWRQEFVDSKEINTEKKKIILKLNIEAGTTPGTRYTFKGEGDRNPTTIPGDIVFITADKPHPVFQRRNLHDLLHIREIDLGQALSGFTFTLETLDRRKLKVVVSDVVKPGFMKIMPGEGLPLCSTKNTPLLVKSKKPMEFGNLIIECDIIFPNYLNRDMKMRCREFFNELKAMEEQALNETDV